MQVQPRDRAAELGDLHVVVPNECGCIRANVLLLRVPCVRVVWCGVFVLDVATWLVLVFELTVT